MSRSLTAFYLINEALIVSCRPLGLTIIVILYGLMLHFHRNLFGVSPWPL